MGMLRSLVRTLLRFALGFLMWVFFLFCNTKPDETFLSIFKACIDLVAVILILSNVTVELIIGVCLVVALGITTVLTLTPVTEVCLLIAYLILSGAVLISYEQNQRPETGAVSHPVSYHSARRIYWKDYNHARPWYEQYSFSPDEGIKISRGILINDEIMIPPHYVRMEMKRSFWQKMAGLCDITFIGVNDGKGYTDRKLKNIRYASYQYLRDVLY